jgi:hypothetical protein
MKNTFLNTVLPLFVVFCLLTGCSAADAGGGSRSESQPAASGLNNTDMTQQPEGEVMSGYLNTQLTNKKVESGETETMLRLKIGNTDVAVNWEENESVEALKALCRDEPLTIHMSMYGGFEQVGPIGKSLPRNDVQTSTSAGDIVLYSGDKMVIFYGSNSWSYTRLGKITGMDGSQLKDLLSGGDVTVVIEY